VNLRPARVGETATLTELALASKRHWGYDDEFMARCAPELAVHDEDVLEGRVVVAAGDDDAPQGFYVLLDESDGALMLDMIFVAPEEIGHGIGRRLFEHALETVRSAGATSLRIESDPFAAGFYERVGALQVGTRRSWSTGRDLPLYELAV
jgi:GNAT superfamily N-acetyltransferase